jgi:hypothetical protein
VESYISFSTHDFQAAKEPWPHKLGVVHDTREVCQIVKAISTQVVMYESSKLQIMMVMEINQI